VRSILLYHVAQDEISKIRTGTHYTTRATRDSSGLPSVPFTANKKGGPTNVVVGLSRRSLRDEQGRAIGVRSVTCDLVIIDRVMLSQNTYISGVGAMSAYGLTSFSGEQQECRVCITHLLAMLGPHKHRKALAALSAAVCARHCCAETCLAGVGQLL
jgi:hypothetical protein